MSTNHEAVLKTLHVCLSVGADLHKREMLESAAALEWALDIIGKLPLTADGVRCAGTMDLWTIAGDEILEIECNEYGLWVKDEHHQQWDLHNTCYSTLEAAQSALAAKEHTP